MYFCSAFQVISGRPRWSSRSGVIDICLKCTKPYGGFNEKGKKMEGMGERGQTVGGCARTEKVCIDPGVMMD